MTSQMGLGLQAETVGDFLRRRVEGEYREMPGLKLTAAQAARLWNLGVGESTRVLDSLVQSGVLHRAKDGAYVLIWQR